MYTITLKDYNDKNFTITCECDTRDDMTMNLARIKKESTRLVKDGILTVIDLEDGLILREYQIKNNEITLVLAQGD